MVLSAEEDDSNHNRTVRRPGDDVECPLDNEAFSIESKFLLNKVSLIDIRVFSKRLRDVKGDTFVCAVGQLDFDRVNVGVPVTPVVM